MNYRSIIAIFIILGSSLLIEEIKDSPAPPTPVLNAGNVGSNLGVLLDKISRITEGELATKCYWFREYKTYFQYPESETGKIFYIVYQCLREDLSVVNEKVFFSYTEGGEKFPLPVGCPPPLIEPPKKEDPCKNGFDVGDVISRTIARLVIPRLLEDNVENPFAQDPIFKEYQELQKKLIATPQDELTDDQKDLIHRFSALLEQSAIDKIKCFSEEVIPIQEVNIKFVCAKEGAYKTVKEALFNTLKSKITCGHINCDRIEQDLRDNMTATSENVQIYLEEGQEDFNGNVQLPKEGEKYILVAKNSSLTLSNAGDFSENAKFIQQKCTLDETSFIIFERNGNFWRLKNIKSSFYITAEKGTEVLNRTLDPTLFQNWTISNRIDGSIIFTNQSNNNVLDIGGNSQLEGAVLINYPLHGGDNQKFYLRKSCPTRVV